jgi:L-asparaginase/glutamin-(asparagin-)ase
LEENFMKKLLFAVLMSLLFASPALAKGTIVILATGGTIAGAAQSATDTVAYKSAVTAVDKLIAGVPELSEVANVKGGEQIAQIGSQDMSDDVWLKLAKRVNELLAQRDIDGVVITHGTDTMEETAYFLNLVVKSNKPVVLVGAMRPGSAISADGQMNIYNAAAVAANPESKNRGVLVVMNDTIHGARAVTKTNTSLVNTFSNHDFGAMGYVLASEPKFYTMPTRIHTTKSEFDVRKLDTLPRVDIVYSYAGISSGVAVDALVKAGAKGIIHAGVGNGSVHKNILPALDEARKGGAIIVRSSRVGSGIVARNGELSDDEHDFVSADSLNPQKAKVLLQLILAKNPKATTKQIQEFFYKY